MILREKYPFYNWQSKQNEKRKTRVKFPCHAGSNCEK